ncbi:MAG: hypothetical protein ACE5E4_04365 [Candidatus Binatia bacterium]
MTTPVWPALLTLLLMAAPWAAAAEDISSRDHQIQDLYQKIEAIERRHEEELRELREEVEVLRRQAEEQGAARFDGGSNATTPVRPAPQGQMLNVFNPRVTVFGNFLARSDSKRVENAEGQNIADRFILREVELDFRAAIDPWADGVIITTLESEVPGEYTTSVEEGYVALKKLPLLDEAPLGLKVRVGRFRPVFGRFNAIHTHDLPQSTRPRSLKNFLGEEGYVQDGLSARFFLPSPGDASVAEAYVAVLNGGGIPVGEANAGEDPAWLGHLKLYNELADGQDLEVGLSAWLGKGDEAGRADSRLYGLDLTYRWQPPARARWRSFVAGGELYAADLEAPSLSTSPLGYYVWSQYQFNQNAYLGLRWDFAEEPEDENLETRTWSVFLSYYTTEFLRLRLGFEHSFSDIPELDSLDTGLLEMNFVFGSHPVEPYWVNR